jgi:hypothetical protein
MISVGGQLCYSPFPPEAYGRGPLGLGPMCKGDMQVWNLMFLSCEGIADHLGVLHDYKTISLMDRDLVACYAALAALNGPPFKAVFPTLRHLLQLPPGRFLENLFTLPGWERLPQVTGIPDWVDVMINKTIELEGVPPATSLNLERIFKMSIGRGK